MNAQKPELLPPLDWRRIWRDWRTTYDFAAECARLAFRSSQWIARAETVSHALRLASRATVEGIAGVLAAHRLWRSTPVGCSCGEVYRGPDDLDALYAWHTSHVAEHIVAYLRGEA